MRNSPDRWILLIVIAAVIGILVVFAGVIAIIISPPVIASGNVALITISGPIMASGGRGILSSRIASSDDIVMNLRRANESSSVKAVLIEINSPGGSAVASAEVVSAVRDVDKLAVAYIRDVGASGAYWAASAADYIFVNRMSVTGSIGATASYLEFSGLLDSYNVTYQRLVSGKHKDMGSPMRKLSDEEEDIFQQQLDAIHSYFVESVASNRNLSREFVMQLAEGQVFLGGDAVELGLADFIGGREEAVKFIESELGIEADIAEYRTRKTFFQRFEASFEQAFFLIGQGIGSAFLSMENANYLGLRT